MRDTIESGVLSIASAYPDPPFDVLQQDHCDGFDIQLMRIVCKELNLKLKTVCYTGDNFENIFDGLINKEYDAVISGTTITPHRANRVLFSKPYLTFNQGVAINKQHSPDVPTTKNLRGLIAGIQHGNTSDKIAKEWLAAGEIADIHYYPYSKISEAVTDLNDGKIGFIVKLFPVISCLVKPYSNLSVAFQVPTNEKIGIAYAQNNDSLCQRIDQTIDQLRVKGVFAQLEKEWFGFLEGK